MPLFNRAHFVILVIFTGALLHQPLFHMSYQLFVFGREYIPISRAAQKSLEKFTALQGEHVHSSHNPHTDKQLTNLPLTKEEETSLKEQWDAATKAAKHLDTPLEAIAAGYLPAYTRGRQDSAAVHWINWELVAAPFDPAKPAMLLFSMPARGDRLVGFSYYVQSAEEPEGFAGPNDRWHRHSGVCIVNGRIVSESVPSSECEGNWLPAQDLWMLHAWVVPQYSNEFGDFSALNPPQLLGPAGD